MRVVLAVMGAPSAHWGTTMGYPGWVNVPSAPLEPILPPQVLPSVSLALLGNTVKRALLHAPSACPGLSHSTPDKKHA